MKKKWILSSCSVFFALVILVIVFLPTLLSSPWGIQMIARSIEAETGGRVQIESLKLSWRKPQKITKLRYEKVRRQSVSFDSLTLEASFWKLLVRRGHFGKLTLNRPRAEFHTVATTYSSKAKTEKSSSSRSKKKEFWSNGSGEVIVTEGRFDLDQIGSDAVKLDQVNLKVSIPKNQAPFSLKIEGKSEQGQLFGHYKADIKLKKARQLEGSLAFNQFPVAGADYLLGIFSPNKKGELLKALGDAVTFHLSASAEEKTHLIDAKLTSPRLWLSLNAEDTQEAIILKAPFQLVWTIKAPLAEKLPLPLKVTSDVRLELHLDRMQLPLKNRYPDFHALAGAGKLKLEKGAFSLKQSKDTLLLDELFLLFETNRLDKELQLSFENAFRYRGFSETKMTGQVKVNDLFSKHSFFDQISELQFNGRNLPSRMLDQLCFDQPYIEEWIGSHFDLMVNEWMENGKKSLRLSGSSPLLRVEEGQFTLDQTWVLHQPLFFEYTLSPKKFDFLSETAFIEGNVTQLSLPLREWRKAKGVLDLKTKEIDLQNFVSLGNLTLPQSMARFEGSYEEGCQFRLGTSVAFQEKTWGQTLLGKEMEVEALGKMQLQNAFKVEPLEIHLEGPRLQSTLEGAFDLESFTLKKTLSIDAQLQPDQINVLLSKENHMPLLAANVPVYIKIKPGQFPLNKKDLSHLDLRVFGYAPEMKMKQPANQTAFTLEKVEMDLLMSGVKAFSRLQLDAQTPPFQEKKGKIELMVESERGSFNPIEKPSNLHVRFDHLESSIADTLLKMRGTLSPMIGSWIDLSFDTKKKDEREDLQIEVKSPFFKMNGAFVVGEELTLSTARHPLKMDWNISEKGYQAFKKWRGKASTSSLAIAIKDRAKIHLEVSPLSLPVSKHEGLFPKVDLNLKNARFDAEMRLDDLSYQQKETGEITTLNRFDLRIQKRAERAPLLLDLEGNIKPQAAGKSGQIKGKASIENAFSDEGHFLWDSARARLELSAYHLPTIFIDALMQMQKKKEAPPSAFLGPYVNASLQGELAQDEGQLKADINATHFKTDVDAIIANGFLYLREPLKASMTLSPKMKALLEQNARVTLTSLKHPMALEIQDKGFALSLKDFSIKNTAIAYGKIDLGQIVCQNRGSTLDVNSLFQEEEAQNLISLWFAPMEFKVHNGLMQISRTEILFNRMYQLALWGDLNFVKRGVNMILGLTAQSLRVALGIQGLDPLYVLQIPVKGSFGNIKIDKGAAVSKIALLIARKEVAPQAGVWGQVFGAIGDLTDDQSTVPPPKPPFPWQNTLNMQEKLPSPYGKKKKAKKKRRTYVEQIKPR